MEVSLFLQDRPGKAKVSDKIHQGGGGTSNCVGLGLGLNQYVSLSLSPVTVTR